MAAEAAARAAGRGTRPPALTTSSSPHTSAPTSPADTPQPQAEPLKFHRHFWGAVDTGSELVAGVDVLRRASAAGVRVSMQFAAFLADRAAAEAQYAAALRRLAQAHTVSASTPRDESLPDGFEEDAACLQGLYNPTSASSNTTSSGSSSGDDKEDIFIQGRPLGGVRDATLAGTERVARALVAEATAAADAHERAAASLRGAAQDVRERAHAYRAQRAALLAEAATASRERAGLEAALRKAQARHAEAVARKDRAAGKLAALEAQGKRAHDLERRRQKLQKVSKEEMVSDALVKEAVDRVRLQHPMWVSKTTAFMDGVQRLEEDRAATLRRAALAAAAAAQEDAARTQDAAVRPVRAAASALDASRDLARWVAASETGAGPQLPPTFVPRASRTSLAESIVAAPATTKPLAIRATVARACSTTLPPLSASSGPSSSSSSSSSQSPAGGTGTGLLRHSTSAFVGKRGSLSATTTPTGADGGAGLTLTPELLGSGGGGGTYDGTTPVGEALRVRALYQFIGEDSDELDFEAGDEFLLLSATHEYNGWWIGQVRKRIGWFPSTFVRIVQRAGRSNSIVSRL